MNGSKGVLASVLAAIIWGALAFGAVYPWAYWPLVVFCTGLGVWTFRANRGWTQPTPRRLLLSFGAIAVAIAVQLVPLPFFWFTRLAPGADRFLAEYDLGYSLVRPAWHALSISPADTAISLALMVSLSVLLVGLTAAFSRVRLEWLIDRLALFGIALSVFGVIQRMFIVDNYPTVYGFWHPKGGLPFGPFVNRNHFACWAVLVLSPVFGYFCALVQMSWRRQGRRLSRWMQWLTTPDASRVALMVFAVATMAGALVLTTSRSGIVSFMVSMAALGYVAVRQAGHRSGRLLAGLAIVVLVAVALQWGNVGVALDRFNSKALQSEGRIGAWQDAVQITKDFPVFGVGLGSFGTAMLIYQTGARDQIYFQTHNDYLQLASEGGLLVGVPVLIALFLIVRTIWRRFRSGDDDLMRYWLRAGAVAGLLGAAAQSVVEFGLQLPGIAVVFVVLLAIALHRPPDPLNDADIRSSHEPARHAHRV